MASSWFVATDDCKALRYASSHHPASATATIPESLKNLIPMDSSQVPRDVICPNTEGVRWLLAITRRGMKEKFSPGFNRTILPKIKAKLDTPHAKKEEERQVVVVEQPHNVQSFSFDMRDVRLHEREGGNTCA